MPKGRVKGERGTKDPLEACLGKEVIAKRFAEEYVATGSGTEAVKRVYGEEMFANAHSKAWRMMRRPEVRDAVRAEFEMRRATPAKAAEIITEAAEATKLVGKDEKERPDHTVRLMAAREMLKVFGVYGEKPYGNETGGSKHLHVYLQEPAEVRKFILNHGRMPSDEERKGLAEEAING